MKATPFRPYKVLNLELSEGIPELLPDGRYQGIFLVVWWHRIPLGALEILTQNSPLSPAQLTQQILPAITLPVGDRLLEHGFKASLPVTKAQLPQDFPPAYSALISLQNPLQKLSQQLEQIQIPPQSSVSVIICTRDRPEQLQHCLRSLQNLHHQPTEILVVDNAPSSDATKNVVAQFPAVRYLLEPQPGLSIARNTGIQASVGDLIAFTDDDVEVHPDWIFRLQQGFHDPRVMAVTGLMLPAELDSEAQLIFHRGVGGPGWKYRALVFDSEFFEAMKPFGVPAWFVGAGANMAFRREVFNKIGLFDERLGAGASGCSEDSELWYRILAEGWHCRYEPAAVVFHYHRKELEHLQEQSFQYMRGHVTALLIQFAKYHHWGNLRRLFVALPRYYSRLLWNALIKGFKGRNMTLITEIFGCFSGIGFYFSRR
ncbi:glycosyl transferase family 2 [filamentous cyanobacterium CCP2]|nr:glycosyl transferase family 2 [filamentous cyanobacterium CCP2]